MQIDNIDISRVLTFTPSVGVVEDHHCSGNNNADRGGPAAAAREGGADAPAAMVMTKKRSVRCCKRAMACSDKFNYYVVAST